MLYYLEKITEASRSNKLNAIDAGRVNPFMLTTETVTTFNATSETEAIERAEKLAPPIPAPETLPGGKTKKSAYRLIETCGATSRVVWVQEDKK